MSDLGMFNAALQHHTLEVIAWQFDGSKDGAQVATAALQRELPLRGAALEGANLRVEQNSRHGDDAYLQLRIRRTVDGEEWETRLRRGHWLVLWLHHSWLHSVGKMTEAEGEGFFRRSNPIVTLRPPQPGAPEISE